jgi:hypothetical protein
MLLLVKVLVVELKRKPGILRKGSGRKGPEAQRRSR